MPSPALIFSFILATLFGSVAHLWVGGDARRLALLLLAGWIGFALGQMAGELLSIQALHVGQVHVLAASLGATIALGVVWFFTRPNLPSSDYLMD